MARPSGRTYRMAHRIGVWRQPVSVTLTGLRCLVEIVEANLNISAAGQAMHLSQSCVSRHLKQVEDSLGFRIFARRGRSLVDITPVGRMAVDVARRVVRDVEGLCDFAANARGETAGELAIAAPQTYALHVLPPLLRRLRERYPDLSVRMHALGDDQRMRSSEHDRFDAVIASSTGKSMPDGTAVPLFRWRRVALVERDHPLAEHSGAIPLAELARWPLVTHEAARQPESTLNRVMARHGLIPRFACSAPDAATIKAYARAGLGVGLVAELSLDPADYSRFAVLPLDAALPDSTAWAILPRGRVLRNATVELVRLLAPDLDADALRRASQGQPPAHWPAPPYYRRAPEA